MNAIWTFIKMLPANVVASLMILLVSISVRDIETRKKPSCLLVVLPSAHWLLRLASRLARCHIDAVAIGNFIFINADFRDDERLIKHECVHIRQQNKHGPLQPIVYLYYSYKAWSWGGDPYFDNRFEKEARAAEAE